MAIFRVWLAQVNQTYLDVEAADSEAAKARAYRKWRQEEAHTQILDVVEVEADGLRDR